MDQSNGSLGLEEDSGHTLTPSHLDETGKVFTFTEVGNEENLSSLLKNKSDASKKEPMQENSADKDDKSEDLSALNMKKNAKIIPDELMVQSHIVHKECDEKQEIRFQKGDTFERLIFVKARTVRKEIANPKPKIVSSIKKSFWIYPITTKEFTKDEKEEADLLTTFGLSPACQPLSQVPIKQSLPFITDYFANYNSGAASRFSFVLNRNEHEAEYANEYNPNGLRHFFGLLISDFDTIKLLDKNQRAVHRLEPSQCLLLLESKYPFDSFFFRLLGHLFDVVRLKRLESFAQHYNGNEHDAANLETVKAYDSASILPVRLRDQILNGEAVKLLDALYTQHFAAGWTFTDPVFGVRLDCRANGLLAAYYEPLESKQR